VECHIFDEGVGVSGVKPTNLKIHYGCEDLVQDAKDPYRFHNADSKVEVILGHDQKGKVTDITLKQNGQLVEIPYVARKGYSLSEMYIPVPYQKPPALFDADAKTAWERCHVSATPPPAQPPAASPAPASAPPAAPSAAASATASQRVLSSQELATKIAEWVIADQYPVDQRPKVIAALHKNISGTLPADKVNEFQARAIYEAYRAQNPPVPAAASPAPASAPPAARPVAPAAAATGSQRVLSSQELATKLAEWVIADKYPVDQRQKVIARVRKLIAQTLRKTKPTELQARAIYDAYRGQNPPVPAATSPVPAAAPTPQSQTARMGTLEKTDLALGKHWVRHYQQLFTRFEKGPIAKQSEKELIRIYKGISEDVDLDFINEFAERYGDSQFKSLRTMVVQLTQLKDQAKVISKDISVELVKRYDQAKTAFLAAIHTAESLAAKGDRRGLLAQKRICRSKFKELLIQYAPGNLLGHHTDEMGAVNKQILARIIALKANMPPAQPSPTGPAGAPSDLPSAATPVNVGDRDVIDVKLPGLSVIVGRDLKAIQEFITKCPKAEMCIRSKELYGIVQKLIQLKDKLERMSQWKDDSPRVQSYLEQYSRAYTHLQKAQEQLVSEVDGAFNAVRDKRVDGDFSVGEASWFKEPNGRSCKVIENDSQKIIDDIEMIFGKLLPASWSSTNLLLEYLPAVPTQNRTLLAYSDMKVLKAQYQQAKAVIRIIENARKGIYPKIIEGLYHTSEEVDSRKNELYAAFEKQFDTAVWAKQRVVVPNVPVTSDIQRINEYKLQLSNMRTSLLELVSKLSDASKKIDDEIKNNLKSYGESEKVATEARSAKIKQFQFELSPLLTAIDNRIAEASQLAEKSKRTNIPELRLQKLKSGLDKLKDSVNISTDESYVWLNAPDAKTYGQEGSTLIQQIELVYKKRPVAAIIVAPMGDDSALQPLKLSLGANRIPLKILRDSRSGNPDILLFFKESDRDIYFRQYDESAAQSRPTPAPAVETPKPATTVAPAVDPPKVAAPVEEPRIRNARAQLATLREQLSQLKAQYQSALQNPDLGKRVKMLQAITEKLYMIASDANGLSIIDHSLQADADLIKSDVEELKLAVYNSSAQSGAIASALDNLRKMPALAAIRDKITYRDGVIRLEGLEVDRCPQLCPEILAALSGTLGQQKILFAGIHIYGTNAQPVELVNVLTENRIANKTIIEPDTSKDVPKVDIAFVLDQKRVASVQKAMDEAQAVIDKRLQGQRKLEETTRLAEITSKRTELKSLLETMGAPALIETKIDNVSILAFRIPVENLPSFNMNLDKMRTLLSTQMAQPILILSNNFTEDEKGDEVDLVAKGLSHKPHVAAYATGMTTAKYLYVMVHDFGTTMSTGRIYEAWQKGSFANLVGLVNRLDQGAAAASLVFSKKIRGVKGLSLIQKPPITLKKSVIYETKVKFSRVTGHVIDRNMKSIAEVARAHGAKVLVMYHNAPTSSENAIVASLAEAPMRLIQSQLTGLHVDVTAKYFRASNITENNGPDIIHYIMLMPGDDEAEVIKQYKAYVDSTQPH